MTAFTASSCLARIGDRKRHSIPAVFRSDRLTFSYPRVDACAELADELCDLTNQRLMSPMVPLPVDPAMILDRIRSSHPAPFTGADRAYELAVASLEAPETAIGIAGLYAIDFAHSVAEIGLSILRPEAQGRGLGIEAHLRWIDYAFNELGLERLTGTAKGGNHRAIAVAERIGLTVEGRLRSHRFVAGERVDIVLFGILRGEWKAQYEVTQGGE